MGCGLPLGCSERRTAERRGLVSSDVIGVSRGGGVEGLKCTDKGDFEEGGKEDVSVARGENGGEGGGLWCGSCGRRGGGVGYMGGARGGSTWERGHKVRFRCLSDRAYKGSRGLGEASTAFGCHAKGVSGFRRGCSLWRIRRHFVWREQGCGVRTDV